MDPKVQEEAAAAKEKVLREEFETFKNEVLKLKQRLETSDKDEDKNTVKVLENVLKEINNQAVDGKFDKVIERLSDPNTFKKIQDAGEVASGNKELHDAMLKLIDLLQNGDDFNQQKRKERLANEKLLEKLKEILSQQERLDHAHRSDQGRQQGPGQDPGADQGSHQGHARPQRRQGDEARFQEERGQVRQQAGFRRQGRGQERHARPQGRGQGQQGRRARRTASRATTRPATIKMA